MAARRARRLDAVGGARATDSSTISTRHQGDVVGKLAGKSIIVTGAARGIGAAIAQSCVEEGAQVVVVDIDPQRRGGRQGDRRRRRSSATSPTDGPRRADRRRDGRAARDARRARQQRRARARGRPARDGHGQLAPHDAAQRRGAVRLVQGGPAGDARSGRRLDRQHLLHRGHRRPAGPLLVRDLEGGARRADPEHRDRLRPARDPLQQRLARVDRQRAVPRVRRGPPGARGGADLVQLPRPRSAAHRRSPPAASTCSPTTRASSTAPTTSSTAAERRAAEGRVGSGASCAIICVLNQSGWGRAAGTEVALQGRRPFSPRHPLTEQVRVADLGGTGHAFEVIVRLRSAARRTRRPRRSRRGGDRCRSSRRARQCGSRSPIAR